MTESLRQPPNIFKQDRQLLRWFNALTRCVTGNDQISWNQVSKNGASLSDIPARGHALLDDINEVDPLDSDTLRDKHLSNGDLKTVTDHLGWVTAHGANGALVGRLDVATTTQAGVVLRARAVSDALASLVAITSVDVSAAPATYNAVWGAELVALTNELKLDLTQVVADLDTLTTTLNDLMNELRSAQQLET